MLPLTLLKGDEVGLFDRKEKPKADFSNVQSGSSSVPDATARPDTGAAQASRYTVKQGDTLSAIAKREYGDANAWRRIYDANRDQLDNPDLIHPGQELTIPKHEGGMS
ncbi:MAG TPA: LysM peptidoglycan-binding domain-containing protein [Longimicrobiales bacterium]